MADPIVHITAGIPDSGTGNITTLGQLQIALLAALPSALGAGGGLKIDGSGTAVPISGTITANAGSNLNTSALAVESGGNLAALNAILGTVTASPTANTIADRLKTINATLGGTLSVSGSAVVTNSGTFAVQAAQSGAWNITNITGTVPLPSGAATAVKQPGIGSAGISSSDVISVQGIASGTALPVSAGSLPLPTGAASAANQTNASAKTQIVDGSGNVIASTSNALNVNVTGGAGGTSSVFGATMPLSGTAVGLFDGTNMVRAKGDETNGLWVNIKAGAGSGGTSAVDEGTFTAGTSAFTPVGGFFQTTATSNPLSTGQYGYLQLTVNRAAHVNLRSAAGVALGVAGAPLVVDGSAVTQPVSGTFFQATQPVSAASLPLPSGASTSAKQPALGTAGTASSDVLTIQGIASMTALKVDGSGVTQPVSLTSTTVTGTVAVTQSGSWSLAANQSVNNAQINGVTPLMGNGTTGTGSQRVTLASDNSALGAAGQGATGASVPSGATQSGARAQSAEATAVTNGQLVAVAADLVGKPIVLPFANPENFLMGNITTAMTGTTDTAVTGMGAQGAGVRNYITSVTVTNDHATVGTVVVLKDGSAGTVLWQGPAAALFGGVAIAFPTPLKTTANTGLFAANLTTGSSVRVSCTGFKGI